MWDHFPVIVQYTAKLTVQSVYNVALHSRKDKTHFDYVANAVYILLLQNQNILIVKLKRFVFLIWKLRTKKNIQTQKWAILCLVRILWLFWHVFWWLWIVNFTTIFDLTVFLGKYYQNRFKFILEGINGAISNISSFFFTLIVSLRPCLIFEFEFVRERLVRWSHSYLKHALSL